MIARFQSHFNTAVKIIQLYDGKIPLHHFLKQYFSQHTKHGSKDRKHITHACYNFYRLGKSFTHESIEEKLKVAIFLCNDDKNEWSFLYEDEWINSWSKLLQKRIVFVQTKHPSFSLNDVFPFLDDVSEGLDTSAFIESFFIQPNVFIRIRPGNNRAVEHKLMQQDMLFNHVNEDCIALSPSSKIDSIITLDKEAVIQDYSSQRIKEFLELIKSKNENQKMKISIWDCCAASGGKSILAYDVFEHIDLTVSDVRSSIIQNLKQRFIKAGIKNYKSDILDIAHAPLTINNSPFDLIICDAPCTGSGTWRRTPERLYFFQPQKISEYASLQKKIVSNVIASVKDNGFLLYITCSIFKKENGEIAMFIQKQLKLELVKTELLTGYHQKADTMFAALFRKIN